ncbi:MAG: hypothetical protein A2X34_00620 [Elusimicrobia bacterium GWC2_51_8]|nr:MAG: hypothetical protein A2X33_06380 [Elusimicrobia bacterium GWA2_51_34]OGR58289.1 MAG: hypothetical protein A2X34_00620 [Elusimicrobia bacterium GWC2_51_8]OGR85068.1 MAG: hypothetical protein A2021_03695 [Elusimicrobia bacterium GWF2_52_66]HAF95003.1 hypothetical protein [Elusimicrobiota bacterium]HCE98787.1 hypothetical protein [Elusimicrobiota bacterium]
MRLIVLTILFLSTVGWAVEPGASPDPQAVQLREHYDKAFSFYMEGNYQKAMEYWNMVLRLDPKQVTARNMIQEARKKMAGSSTKLKGAFYALIKKGAYADALITMESILAADPTNQDYQKLQNRLRTVSGIVPRKISAAKHWKIAAEGLAAWLNEKEDKPFAYDALRYALEFSPAESRFQRLISALEEENPQLKLNDTKPPNVGVLENKKDVALHYIYDSKFYQAVKELESALRLEPGDVTSLKRLGSAYLQLKDYPRAKTAWQKAAKLSPGDEQLTQYLAALDKVAPSSPDAPRVRKKRRLKPKAQKNRQRNGEAATREELSDRSSK